MIFGYMLVLCLFIFYSLWYLAKFPQIFTEIIKQSLIAKVSTILIINVKIGNAVKVMEEN